MTRFASIGKFPPTPVITGCRLAKPATAVFGFSTRSIPFNQAVVRWALQAELGVIGTDLLVASAPPRTGFADRMDDGGHFPHFRVGRFGKQRQATDVFLRNDGLIEKSPNLIERLAAESDFSGEPAAFFADMYPMPRPEKLSFGR